MLFVTLSDYCNYNKYANNSERKLSSVDIDKLKNKDLPPDEFIKLSKHIVSQDTIAKELRFSDHEYAFYTAVADNNSALEILGKEKYRELSIVLTDNMYILNINT